MTLTKLLAAGVPVWLTEETEALVNQAERVIVGEPGQKMGVQRKAFVRDALTKLLAARGVRRSSRPVVELLIELVVMVVKRVAKAEAPYAKPLTIASNA